jgi:frataxin-like iron-binding protein CyaY
MTKRYFNLKNQVFTLSVLAVLAVSCGGEEPTVDQIENPIEKKDPSSTQLMEIDGKVFSIPSPIQTAILIKNAGTNYNKDILNAPSKVTNYSTSFKKAINLGIYGADLGYVTMYDQTQDAISFLTAVKSIADDLGVSSAFDLELVERFEKNIGNQDSLLVLVSDAYKSSDRYLKGNQQNDIGGLILAGGWIESLYFATNSAKMTDNKEIIKRIGEQKTTVYNLIKLLTPYYSKTEFTKLIDDLMELNEIYEQVESTYTYVKSSVDIENKTTTINSTTVVNISDDQLKAITDKVMQIRVEIIS